VGQIKREQITFLSRVSILTRVIDIANQSVLFVFHCNYGRILYR